MQKFIRTWGSDGSSVVADTKQKMSDMIGSMPGLDMSSMIMNSMFDNKNIDNALALYELSDGDDEE